MIQGGDPLGNGTGGPGYEFARRVPPGPRLRQAVPAGHGQRRPGHQRLAVLHHRRADHLADPQAHHLRRGRRRRQQEGRGRIIGAPTNPRTDRPLEDVVIETVVVEKRRRAESRTLREHHAPPARRVGGASPCVGPHRGVGIMDQAVCCYRHPDRETGIRCTRCDRPICPDCMVSASVGFQCTECVGEARAGRAPAAHGRRRHRARPTRSWSPRSSSALNVAVFLLVQVNGDRLASTWGCTRSAAPAPSPASRRASASPTAPVVPGAHLGVPAQEYWHIGFNMLSLWWIGAPLERLLGRTRYLALYLVSGARRQRAGAAARAGRARPSAPRARSSACSARPPSSCGGCATTCARS